VADHLGQATTAPGGSGLVGMAASAPSRSQKVPLQEESSSTCLLITTVVLQRLTKPGGGYAEGMAKELLSDELWEVIEPLLPEEPPKPKGGRPRIDDRAALTGIFCSS
jgi:Putative transposase of IS4/5 family (DUF4096)